MLRTIFSAWLMMALCPVLLTGCSREPGSTAGSGTDKGSFKKTLTVCLLPKKKGLPYFSSCADGARQAAKELGNINLIYDGPTDGSPEKAAAMIEQWTLKGVDVIAVSPNDPKVVGPAMKKARERGVHVITWDADADPETRGFFVNQATPEQIGYALVDTMAKELGPTGGEVAIVTAYLAAANQNEWIKHMKARLNAYPKIKLVAIKPSNEDQKLAFQVTQDLMKAYPDLKGFFAISSVAFPGAAEAVQQAGKAGRVLVIGLSTPNNMRQYVLDGVVRSVIIWNTSDLGYLTIYAAEAYATGKLKVGATSFQAGRLGNRKVVGDNILLGDILIITKANINNYHF